MPLDCKVGTRAASGAFVEAHSLLGTTVFVCRMQALLFPIFPLHSILPRTFLTAYNSPAALLM